MKEKLQEINDTSDEGIELTKQYVQMLEDFFDN